MTELTVVEFESVSPDNCFEFRLRSPWQCNSAEVLQEVEDFHLYWAFVAAFVEALNAIATVTTLRRRLCVKLAAAL